MQVKGIKLLILCTNVPLSAIFVCDNLDFVHKLYRLFSLFKAYHFLDYMNKTEISLYLFYYINNLIYILLSKRYVFIVYNKTWNTHHIVFFL